MRAVQYPCGEACQHFVEAAGCGRSCRWPRCEAMRPLKIPLVIDKLYPESYK